jgi:hypothetical protein
MDETSFIIPEFDPSDPPYFFELLAADGIGLGNLSPGELATVPEPPIPDIGVCLSEICTETGVDGSFTLQPEKAQDTYYLKFSDPHTDDPIRAFRYINKWNGPVVIESYEKDGVTVPEQHLNDTENVVISEKFLFSPKSNIGLMQGFVTFPMNMNDYDLIFEIHGFDHDPRVNYVIDYKGDTRLSRNPGTPGTGDGHVGTDYGLPIGSILISSNSGSFEYWESQTGNGIANNCSVRTNLPKKNGHHMPTTVYGHCMSSDPLGHRSIF